MDRRDLETVVAGLWDFYDDARVRIEKLQIRVKELQEENLKLEEENRAKGDEMKNQWKSNKLYEHPAKHQTGTFGNVMLSPAGVYALSVGRTIMSCPQDWAAGIHKAENNQAE